MGYLRVVQYIFSFRKKILKFQGQGDESLNLKKEDKTLFEALVTTHNTLQHHILLHRCPHFKPRWLTVVFTVA
jgi:hypothetical protein